MRRDRNAPRAFLPLKPNWFHILLSLADQDRHGYSIMQEVLERTGGKLRLWPATLYGSLKRLMEEGLIEESEERPAPELDDARRRYYHLTSLGKRVLAAESDRLEELVRLIHARRHATTREAVS
jgi:DNA-binding PadR family transcriptional regulator